MPKLKVFTVCDKVIMDHLGVPSLIGIFQRMNIRLQDAPIPDNALAPVRWSIFTLWQHTPEEKDIEFVQLTEVFTPKGIKYAEVTSKFMITKPGDLQSKNQIEIFGLPISDEGFMRITLRLEGVDGSEADYQFAITHIPKEQNDENPPSIVQ